MAPARLRGMVGTAAVAHHGLGLRVKSVFMFASVQTKIWILVTT